MSKTRKPSEEAKIVTQYLWEHHRTSLQWRRVRLGVLPNKELNRMYSVLLRWADAIFIEDGTVTIIEAKLTPRADAVGQLLLYKELFVNTPEFQQYWNAEVKLMFLCPRMDLALAELCSKQNITYELYNPEGTTGNIQGVL